jgi:hypothetical protein
LTHGNVNALSYEKRIVDPTSGEPPALVHLLNIGVLFGLALSLALWAGLSYFVFVFIR